MDIDVIDDLEDIRRVLSESLNNLDERKMVRLTQWYVEIAVFNLGRVISKLKE